MALTIRLDEGPSFTKTLTLAGRLDNETAPDLDRELDKVLENPRSFLRAQKSMRPR